MAVTTEQFQELKSLIESNRNILISGKEKTGKSILLKNLAYSLANNQQGMLIRSGKEPQILKGLPLDKIADQTKYPNKDWTPKEILNYYVNQIRMIYFLDSNDPDEYASLYYLESHNHPIVATVESDSVENTLKIYTDSVYKKYEHLFHYGYGRAEKDIKRRIDYVLHLEKDDNNNITLEISEIEPIRY